ncbi:glycine rich domain-containing protein [Bacteroides sp.]|uniref:glycine rich domain-containing protein n=1 Tax=Bacteroides sp. TaxID=29523 RepID=UPI0034CD0D24
MKQKGKTLPAGRYKLQCWGAQGGNSYSYSGVGSKGGYSEGENGKGVNKYNSVHAFTIYCHYYPSPYSLFTNNVLM